MLSGNLLPVHYKVKPDELFTSWLARICHGNVISTHTFSKSIWPNTEVWTRDIDRRFSTLPLDKIAGLTGHKVHEFENSFLSKYVGYVFEDIISNSGSPWVSALSKRHRKSLSNGLRFCPLCLAEDDTPYFRTLWRMAFYPVCLIHNCLLESKCKNCNSSVNYYKPDFESPHIAICQECHFDFSETSPTYPSVLPMLLKNMHTASKSGVFLISNNKIDSLLTFPVVRLLARLLLGKKRKELQDALIIDNTCGYLNFEVYLRRNGSLENLNSNELLHLFNLLEILLSDWPYRFIEAFTLVSLTKSRILHDANYVPYWFEVVVDREFNMKPTPFTLAELESAVRLMKLNNIDLNMGELRSMTENPQLMSNNRGSGFKLRRFIHAKSLFGQLISFSRE